MSHLVDSLMTLSVLSSKNGQLQSSQLERQTLSREDLFSRGHHPELTVDCPSPSRHRGGNVLGFGENGGSRPQSRSTLEIVRVQSGRRTPKEGRVSRNEEGELDSDASYEIVYEEERE